MNSTNGFSLLITIISTVFLRSCTGDYLDFINKFKEADTREQAEQNLQESNMDFRQKLCEKYFLKNSQQVGVTGPHKINQAGYEMLALKCIHDGAGRIYYTLSGNTVFLLLPLKNSVQENEQMTEELIPCGKAPERPPPYKPKIKLQDVLAKVCGKVINEIFA